MKPPEDLASQLGEKTNEELLAMFDRPHDWLPEALDFAKAELQKRGIDTNVIGQRPPSKSIGQPLFFPVSGLKLVMMSTVTFGIYEIYWFYKNWKFIKLQSEKTSCHFGVLYSE